MADSQLVSESPDLDLRDMPADGQLEKPHGREHDIADSTASEYSTEDESLGSDSDECDTGAFLGGDGHGAAPKSGWETSYALGKLQPVALEQLPRKVRPFDAPLLVDEEIRTAFGQSKGFPLLMAFKTLGSV